MPSQEELEWFLSRRGKDGMGAAVFYDSPTGSLQTVPQFEDRLEAWRASLPDNYDDPFRLKDMPSRALIDALVHHVPGVRFNLRTHRVEFSL